MLRGLPRRTAAPSLALWLCTCAPVVAPRPALPEPPPCEPAPTEDRAPSIPCAVEPRPTPPVVVPAPPGCAVVPQKLQRKIHAAIARRYTDLQPDERLLTHFKCDPLGEPVELVYEAVDRRGERQSVKLVRLRWQDRAVTAVSLTLIEAHLGFPDVLRRGFDPAGHYLLLDFGTVPDTIDLPEVRGLMLATTGVIEPPPPPPGRGKGGRGGSYTANDLLHTRVRLRDAAGHVLERSRVVGPASDLKTLPLRLVSEAIEPTLRRLDHGGSFDLEAAQDLLVEHFLAVAPAPTARAWQRAEWAGQWQNQALVRMASTIGTTALIPTLVELARHDIDSDGQRLVRHHALVALAALTGVDARRDTDGAVVTDAVAADRYAAACAAHLPPVFEPPVFSPEQPGPPD